MTILEQRDAQVLALSQLRQNAPRPMSSGYQAFLDREVELLATIWELEQQLPDVPPWPCVPMEEGI